MKTFALTVAFLASISLSANAASQSSNKKPAQKPAASSSAEQKQTKPVEEAETVKFALECTHTNNPENKRYFIQSSKAAYSTNGRDSVVQPTLYATEDTRYVYVHSTTISGSTFDYETQINRQNLNMTVFSDMRGDEKKTYSGTTRYTCVQTDPEASMKLVKTLMSEEAAKEAAKKKELLENKKL